MTLGMRDTAGRRGAPGPTDSGGRTQAQQQQRRALTVRRAARHKRPRLEDPPPPTQPALPPDTTFTCTLMFGQQAARPGTGRSLFPCPGLEKETAIKKCHLRLTSGSNLSRCLVQICRRYFRRNISVKGMIPDNAIVEHWPQ